jgi:hypothetical protein
VHSRAALVTKRGTTALAGGSFGLTDGSINDMMSRLLGDVLPVTTTQWRARISLRSPYSDAARLRRGDADGHLEGHAAVPGGDRLGCRSEVHRRPTQVVASGTIPSGGADFVSA